MDVTDEGVPAEFELNWTTNLVYTGIGNTNHLGSARFSAEISDIFVGIALKVG